MEKKQLEKIAGLEREGRDISPASIKRGVTIAENHPLDKILTKCGECNVRFVCDSFQREARCFFEIEALKARKQKLNSIASKNPEDLLVDLQVTIRKLEQAIGYDSVAVSPKDLRNLAYLKMQLYKLKHVQPNTFNQQNIQIDASQTSIDVKGLMAEMRKKVESKPVDKPVIDVVPIVATSTVSGTEVAE